MEMLIIVLVISCAIFTTINPANSQSLIEEDNSGCSLMVKDLNIKIQELFTKMQELFVKNQELEAKNRELDSRNEEMERRLDAFSPTGKACLVSNHF